MKNKLYLLAAAACGLFATSLSNADESVTVDLTYGSEYVFRGIKLGEATIHPSVELAMDDFYVGVWGALPQKGRGWNTFYEDEIDFYVGQSFEMDGFVLDGGLTWYTYDKADETLEFYLGASTEIEAATVSAYLYRDIDLNATTLELSGAYTLAVSDQVNVDLGLYFGVVNGSDDYSYYGIDAVAPFEVSDSFTVSVGLHVAGSDGGVPVRNVTDSLNNPFTFENDDSHAYFSLSGTYGF